MNYRTRKPTKRNRPQQFPSKAVRRMERLFPNQRNGKPTFTSKMTIDAAERRLAAIAAKRKRRAERRTKAVSDAS